MPFEPTPDKLSGAMVTITNEHSKIHDGKAFKTQYEAATAGAGEETAIGFLTPPLPTLIHFIMDAWANDESILELREDPAIVLGSGSPLLILNRFRGSANQSAILSNAPVGGVANNMTTYTVAEANTAGLAGGTILHHERLAIGGTGPFASVMNVLSRGQREIVLLPETEYVAIITAVAAGGATNNIILNWYESADVKYIR